MQTTNRIEPEPLNPYKVFLRFLTLAIAFLPPGADGLSMTLGEWRVTFERTAAPEPADVDRK